MKRLDNMQRNYFNLLLQISAFLAPFYFIYYGPLHDNPNQPFSKSIWKFVIAGFCFYSILITVLIVTKKGVT